ncbi:MAG: sodium:calcium antiporter [Actinomycetia bacterium]|nr:sodium:calcium antiporter [Actinomycetes bacterium]
MTTALWIAAVVFGFALTVKASSEAVDDATELSRGSRLPPFFVGMTLLALGTDLPEMANSVAASFTDNGDVNVGDSIGSTTTQLTLVFGLLPFVAGKIPLGERRSAQARGQQTTAWITALAMLALALLLADDHIGRLDACLLILAWIAGSRLVYRDTRTEPQLALGDKATGRLRFVGRLLLALVLIGAGATLAVKGMTQLAEIWGVPEFVIAFFGASIGTSLPELVVSFTALRRGEASLAIGDVLGSSFADATLSISIGPLLFPTVIDGGLAVKGALVAAGAAVVVALLLGRGGEHDRRSGAILLLIYAASWPILL